MKLNYEQREATLMAFVRIRRLLVAVLSVAALAAGLVVTPAAATLSGDRHSHVVEWVLKPSYSQYTTDDGATWVNEEPDGWDSNTLEFSSDSGATWTATQAEYNTGEAGTDSNDGGNVGQFRAREPHSYRLVVEGNPRWSTDAGATWTAPALSVPSGFDFTTVEYSSDSGATWTATEAQYNTGEAGADSGDGPDAGTFQRRQPHQRQRTWVCTDLTGAGEAVPESGSAEQTVTEIGMAGSAPTAPRCLVWHSGSSIRTYTTNVDDGIEPPGDWCAAGASAIICRGEGYTYREARRELGF